MLEENSLIDEEQPRLRLPRPRPPEVYYPQRRQQSARNDDGEEEEEDDDDDFVCNPPPTIRAPAVITVPTNASDKNSGGGSSKKRRHRPLPKGSFPTAQDFSSLEEEEDDCQDYAMRLLSNILFLVSSCLYLQVAVLQFLQTKKSNDQDNDTMMTMDLTEPTADLGVDEEDGTMAVYRIIAIASSIGFFLVGCLEFYMADTMCTRFWVGGMMIVAALLGLTSTVLEEEVKEQEEQDYAMISALLTAISLHAYAVVAVSIFVLHEDFADENASCTTSRGGGSDEPVDTKDRQQQQEQEQQQQKQPRLFPKEPSPWWRRMADNAFMVGTILDAVLSYFNFFDIASAAAALPMASIGAACCWMLAAILYLVVTVQSGQQQCNFDNLGASSRSFCCCKKKRNKELCGNDNFHSENVAITVVEGDSTSISKQDSKGEEGFFSYYGRQLMETNFDSICTDGGGQHCIHPSIGEKMNAAELSTSAKIIMKQVDSVFEHGGQHCIHPSIGEKMNAAELSTNAKIFMKQVDSVFEKHIFCG
jgi:hypothetical protein